MEILDGAKGKLLILRLGVVVDWWLYFRRRQATDRDTLGIFDAINYFRHFFTYGTNGAIAIAIAIAAELAASQMMGYPASACLYNSRLPTSFAIRTPVTLKITTYRY